MSEQDSKGPDTDSIVLALKAEKERGLQALAAKYDRLIAEVQALTTGVQIEINPTDTMRQTDSTGAVSIGPGEFHNLSYTKAARSILEKVKKPLLTQEILTYFERSGRKMPGKNPVATLYSSLKKSSEFELVSRNTWGLSDWYEKKRKAPQSLADRTTEIMRKGAISFVDAKKQAEREIEKEEKGA